MSSIPHRPAPGAFDSIVWIPADLARFDTTETNSHRVASGSGGWAERFGSDLLISYKNDPFRDRVLEELKPWSDRSQWSPARVFGKFLPRKNEDRAAPVILSGDPAVDLKTVVMERGIKYGLDFAAGYSAGLFIDQRSNREFLGSLKPKKLLNTFAYTCSFSVVAALTGAQTLSVDLSKKSLDRGRENFALNNIPVEKAHRFLADDVLDVLPRLARRGEKFDAIILDPPTFSRGADGRRWQVEDGMEQLLELALDVAERNARILLSTNCTKLEVKNLEAIARFVVKTRRLGATFHLQPRPVDIPQGDGARSMWILLRS